MTVKFGFCDFWDKFICRTCLMCQGIWNRWYRLLVWKWPSCLIQLSACPGICHLNPNRLCVELQVVPSYCIFLIKQPMICWSTATGIELIRGTMNYGKRKRRKGIKKGHCNSIHSESYDEIQSRCILNTISLWGLEERRQFDWLQQIKFLKSLLWLQPISFNMLIRQWKETLS
jgi:hypothetical protein